MLLMVIKWYNRELSNNFTSQHLITQTNLALIYRKMEMRHFTLVIIVKGSCNLKLERKDKGRHIVGGVSLRSLFFFFFFFFRIHVIDLWKNPQNPPKIMSHENFAPHHIYLGLS